MVIVAIVKLLTIFSILYFNAFVCSQNGNHDSAVRIG